MKPQRAMKLQPVFYRVRWLWPAVPGLFACCLLLTGTFSAHAQSTYPPYAFSTLAGKAGFHGLLDGTGSAARFFFPNGVAADSAGNVYVADTKLNAIRKVTADGVVTTLAGGTSGSADGTSTNAQFGTPTDVAVDSAGNVYVADYYNATIRKVTAGGVVTTLAGRAGEIGSADGSGNAARFHYPTDVAVDSAGNLYVADDNNSTIRQVTPGGAVTTLAGQAGHVGSTDGTGSAALFYNPHGVAVDDAGNLYVADYNNHTIRKGSVIFSLIGFGFMDQRFRFTVMGPAGSNAVISASTDLQTWLPLITNLLTGGSFDFTDTLAPNYTRRFYRADLE